MAVAEYSNYPHIINAPRDLCPVERSPPSTLRDSRYGSVQWVVEAIMDLIPNAPAQQDFDTLLRQPTGCQVVTRIAFPFIPSSGDVSPLRDEPFFGEDVRKDAFGSRRLTDEELESGKKAMVERFRTRGGNWEVYVKGFSVGKSTVWSELYTPAGALIATDSKKLPIILLLKHTGAQAGLKSLFRTAKSKPVHPQHAVVTLQRTTSTRGGKEKLPHNKSALLRQQEFVFGGHSSTSPGPAISYEDTDPVELDLTLDLQSDTPSGNHASVPANLYTPSFRTPNFQHEFFLTVSLSFVEDPAGRFVGRFPVQVVPAAEEDGNQLPTFGEAVRRQAPPAFGGSVDAS